MFIKRMVHGLFAAALAAMALEAASARATAITQPAGLLPGQQYQLVFVSKDTIDASSSLESTYNTFITSEAAPLTAALPAGVTWQAMASTADGTSAFSNAPTHAGIPIYNTLGQLVATGAALWSDTLQNSINGDQDGTAYGSTDVWTGTNPDGSSASPTGFGTAILGGEAPVYGVTAYYQGSPVNGGWIYNSPFGNPELGLDIYGLSSLITVPETASAPEPSSFVIAVLGVACLCCFALRKKLRRA